MWRLYPFTRQMALPSWHFLPANKIEYGYHVHHLCLFWGELFQKANSESSKKTPTSKSVLFPCCVTFSACLKRCSDCFEVLTLSTWSPATVIIWWMDWRRSIPQRGMKKKLFILNFSQMQEFHESLFFVSVSYLVYLASRAIINYLSSISLTSGAGGEEASLHCDLKQQFKVWSLTPKLKFLCKSKAFVLLKIGKMVMLLQTRVFSIIAPSLLKDK